MRFKPLFTSFVIILLFILGFVLAPNHHIYADPYGRAAYGQGTYNCNSEANGCNQPSNNGSSLTNTGMNIVFIVGGAFILSALAVTTLVVKRHKKPNHKV